jgi:hypothetical protein
MKLFCAYPKSAINPVFRYDLSKTFTILVGKEPLHQQQLFTAHTNVLTHRSEFFRAARSSQWLSDPAKPVDLGDHDPEVFSDYLECVYFGTDAIRVDLTNETPDCDENEADQQEFEDTFKMSLEECGKHHSSAAEAQTPFVSASGEQMFRLIQIYLQADKLQDLVTANLVMDELIRFVDTSNRTPGDGAVNHVYENIVHGNPLRMLMRDYSIHHTCTSDYLGFHTPQFHSGFYRDFLTEFIRGQDFEDSGTCVHSTAVTQAVCADRCRYHQHKSTGLSCAPKAAAKTCACTKTTKTTKK